MYNMDVEHASRARKLSMQRRPFSISNRQGWKEMVVFDYLKIVVQGGAFTKSFYSIWSSFGVI